MKHATTSATGASFSVAEGAHSLLEYGMLLRNQRHCQTLLNHPALATMLQKGIEVRKWGCRQRAWPWQCHVVICTLAELVQTICGTCCNHLLPRKYIENALEIHELFNLAQMLQGENLPANIGELRRCVEEKSPCPGRLLPVKGFVSSLVVGNRLIQLR